MTTKRAVLSEALLHGVRRPAVALREQVRIGVGRERYLGASEDLNDEAHLASGGSYGRYLTGGASATIYFEGTCLD